MLEDVYVNGESMKAFGYILKHKSIGVAEPRMSYVEVPGRNGKIDITDFTGLTYSNRPITVQLKAEDHNLYMQARQKLEAINGRNVDISFSSEPNVTWRGRVSVRTYERNSRRFCDAEIFQDADPWPYHTLTGEELVPDV